MREEECRSKTLDFFGQKKGVDSKWEWSKRWDLPGGRSSLAFCTQWLMKVMVSAMVSPE